MFCSPLRRIAWRCCCHCRRRCGCARISSSLPKSTICFFPLIKTQISSIGRPCARSRVRFRLCEILCGFVTLVFAADKLRLISRFAGLRAVLRDAAKASFQFQHVAVLLFILCYRCTCWHGIAMARLSHENHRTCRRENETSLARASSAPIMLIVICQDRVPPTDQTAQ